MAKESAKTEVALQNVEKELVEKKSLLQQLQVSRDAFQQVHKQLSSQHEKTKRWWKKENKHLHLFIFAKEHGVLKQTGRHVIAAGLIRLRRHGLQFVGLFAVS